MPHITIEQQKALDEIIDMGLCVSTDSGYLLRIGSDSIYEIQFPDYSVKSFHSPFAALSFLIEKSQK